MRQDKYSSNLDLTKDYHQIRVRPADVHKTAFVTMGQHYEYLQMPFGMVDSGMTVTRAVRKLLDGLDNVIDYIDNLLVYTRTWEEHSSSCIVVYALCICLGTLLRKLC